MKLIKIYIWILIYLIYLCSGNISRQTKTNTMKTNKTAMELRSRRLAKKTYWSRIINHNKKLHFEWNRIFENPFKVEYVRIACSNGLVMP